MSPSELRQRRHQLLVVLAALQLERRLPVAPELLASVHIWLDTWAGVGHVVTGLARQGYDLQLIGYGLDRRWRATVFVAGREHSIVAGTAWEPTPWGAVQMAAFGALRKAEGRHGPAAS